MIRIENDTTFLAIRIWLCVNSATCSVICVFCASFYSRDASFWSFKVCRLWSSEDEWQKFKFLSDNDAVRTFTMTNVRPWVLPSKLSSLYTVNRLISSKIPSKIFVAFINHSIVSRRESNAKLMFVFRTCNFVYYNFFHRTDNVYCAAQFSVAVAILRTWNYARSFHFCNNFYCLAH